MTILLAFLLLQDNPLETAPEPNEETIHQALRDVKSAMTDALNTRNLDALVEHLHPNVIFSTMNGDVCQGPEEIKAYFHKMLGGENPVVKDLKVSFEADDLTDLYDQKFGVAYGWSMDQYVLSNGKEFEISGRWTCVLVNENDKWMISAFHYSANIFNNPILDAHKSMIPKIGFGAAAVALLGGFFLGYLIGRGRSVQPKA